MQIFYKSLAIISIAAITACGSLPDKEQAYKESVELPPLEVPPNLTTSSIDDPVVVTSEALVTPKAKAPEVETTADIRDSSAAESEEALTYLEIGDSFPQAWRLVGKALSRVDAEVFDQNRSIGIYYVLYEDEEAQEAQTSFWSKLTFWRDEAVDTEEQEYRLKLQEQGDKTTLMVLDDMDKAQSRGPGLKLLQLVEEKLLEAP